MKVSGNLFVIAAPSGAGKTSLVEALVESTPGITVSISHTTRPQRAAEKEGVNYYFIDETTFRHMLAAGDFLEHAHIFNHFYGTSKTWVEETLRKGIDVILEIDWQGHQQIKRLFPHIISIFILPPSFRALEERLTARNQDHPEIIKTRLEDARETLSHLPEFDYVVMNDQFPHALEDLKTIINSTKLLTHRQLPSLEQLINNLSSPYWT